MPSTNEMRERRAAETELRNRLAVPAFAGGFLYLLSAIIVATTFKGVPTVGLLEGLKPAVSGVAEPAVSPRTPEVKFLSHHAFALIAGSVLAAVAVGALILVLLLLLDATRFRRPNSWPHARPLVIAGGVAWALANVVHEIGSAIETHDFAVGHDHSIKAANHAITGGVASVVAYLGLLAGLALAVGMIAAMVNALRVGLLARWMAILGIFSALFLFLPVGAELQVVPALWLVMMGLLLRGTLRGNEPPAWAAAEARPWPRMGAASTRPSGAGQAAGATAAAGGVPAPQPAPAGGARNKRRRKRGGRG